MFVPILVGAGVVAWYTGVLGALVSAAGVGPALPLPLGSYRVTDKFGPRWRDPNTQLPVPEGTPGAVLGTHSGVDLGCAEGTPVYSCTDGTVTSVSVGEANGLAVFVTEPSGRRWCYLHLSSAVVAPLDKVKRGQQVAFSGRTGRVTGPHLHLQVYEGTGSGGTTSTTIDPMPLFPAGL